MYTWNFKKPESHNESDANNIENGSKKQKIWSMSNFTEDFLYYFSKNWLDFSYILRPNYKSTAYINISNT
jgi:hypothetical protein